MTQPIHLLLVHDHHLHRECLAAALAVTGRFRAVETAASAEAALARLRQAPADVALLDWGLPGGGALETTRSIARDFPGVKVLLLGVPETAENVRACAEAGAAGYHRKEETLEQLTARIEQVIRGETDCSPDVARRLFSHLSELADAHRGDADGDGGLTGRELQVLQLIADGLSNKQIAGRLHLSLHTVKNHVHNLLGKLAAEGRYQAVRFAHQKQWLKAAPADPGPDPR
jgi:DNA-binding NarL/FixJ family response regulator